MSPQLQAPAARASSPGTTSTQHKPRPVLLQTRRGNGLWSTLIELDAANEDDEQNMYVAVPLLCHVDPALQCRVMPKQFAFTGPLLTYSHASGWTT